MPQLDKYAFITEFFWLTIVLLGIYYLSSFYILPLVLRNMIVRKNLTALLHGEVSLAPFLSEFILEDYVPNVSAKKFYLYCHNTSISKFVWRILKTNQLFARSLRNIFIRPVSFKHNYSVTFYFYNALSFCKVYFFFLWVVIRKANNIKI